MSVFTIAAVMVQGVDRIGGQRIYQGTDFLLWCAEEAKRYRSGSLTAWMAMDASYSDCHNNDPIGVQEGPRFFQKDISTHALPCARTIYLRGQSFSVTISMVEGSRISPDVETSEPPPLLALTWMFLPSGRS